MLETAVDRFPPLDKPHECWLLHVRPAAPVGRPRYAPDGATLRRAGCVAPPRGHEPEPEALAFARHKQSVCTVCVRAQPHEQMSLGYFAHTPSGGGGNAAWGRSQPAASSRLQGASALASADRYAGGQHAARIPCSTLASAPHRSPLGRVQLWNLGSTAPRYRPPPSVAECDCVDCASAHSAIGCIVAAEPRVSELGTCCLKGVPVRFS